MRFRKTRPPVHTTSSHPTSSHPTSSHRPSALVVLVVAAVLVVAVASCGVGDTGSASKIDSDNVPFGLLDETTGTTLSPQDGQAATIYLARADLLVPVVRTLSPPIGVGELIDALNRGPTDEETRAGLRSALSQRFTVTFTDLAGGVATVDLDKQFTSLSSTDQVLSLAEVVFTVTGQPGVGRVRFTLDGEQAEIPRANGSLTSRSVSRDDYLPVAPVP